MIWVISNKNNILLAVRITINQTNQFNAGNLNESHKSKIQSPKLWHYKMSQNKLHIIRALIDNMSTITIN